MIDTYILEYIDLAGRTENVPVVDKARLTHSGLGMMSELGELALALESGDTVNLLEEVGDILWYWALAMRVLGIPKQLETPSTDFMFATRAQRIAHLRPAGHALTIAVCAWGDLVRRHVIHNKPLSVDDA